MGVGSFATFFKSLDDDSGKRGKQWKVACKWFLENDGAYSELEKVWLWDAGVLTPFRLSSKNR